MDGLSRTFGLHVVPPAAPAPPPSSRPATELQKETFQNLAERSFRVFVCMRLIVLSHVQACRRHMT